MFLVGVEEVELDMIRFRFVRLVLLISRWGGGALVYRQGCESGGRRICERV